MRCVLLLKVSKLSKLSKLSKMSKVHAVLNSPWRNGGGQFSMTFRIQERNSEILV